MVIVLASSVVYRGLSCSPRVWYIVGLSPGRVKPKTIKLVFAASPLYVALRRKSEDWLAPNQNNVSEWSDMFIRGLLFQ